MDDYNDVAVQDESVFEKTLWHNAELLNSGTELDEQRAQKLRNEWKESLDYFCQKNDVRAEQAAFSIKNTQDTADAALVLFACNQIELWDKNNHTYQSPEGAKHVETHGGMYMTEDGPHRVFPPQSRSPWI